MEISPGSLSSVFFLKQEEIKEIFENPDLVQNKITSFFPEVRKLNLADISKIVNIGKKIKPIDKNYKSHTSEILCIFRRHPLVSREPAVSRCSLCGWESR